MKKIIGALCAGVIMFGCFVGGAIAASNNVEISALLSYSTPVKYNGHLQEFKNVNGETVYPILYQGTTYLPVRAVCNMLDIAVDYDMSTGTVYLGERDRVMVNEEMLKDNAQSGIKWTTDSSALVVDGKNYPSGFKTDKQNNFAAYPQIKLDKKYTTFSFLIHNDSDTQELTMEIKNVEDKNVIKDVVVPAGESMFVEVPVSGVNTVGFQIGSALNVMSSNKMKVIIVDMGLK